MDRTDDVTRILADAASDSAAWNRLLPLVYDELAQLARAQMRRERADHTLQATALVGEAWMRLVRDREMAWTSRKHFYGAAARAMQRVLVDHARAAKAHKRGGGEPRASVVLDELPVENDPERWLALSDAFDTLEREDARTAEVARLRVLAGLEFADVARALELSERTVMREWSYARARLSQLLGHATDS